MDTFELIRKTRKYLDYIEEHVSNVCVAWGVLQNKCGHMHFVYDDYIRCSIDSAVEQHDISKLSVEEFCQYREKFFPVYDKSPVDLGSAWEHHKAHNMHHWQTWTKEDFVNPYEVEVHCVHMVLDWMAMGMKFGNTAQQYYEKNRNEIILPEWAIELIQEIFTCIESEDK